MAPKSSSGKERAMQDDEDEPLQAVILADSFNKRFRPLTTDKPRCLLPICNAPLIEWAFESLALAGVQEIFVVCRSHSELVKAAIRDSKWSQPSSGVKVVPIVAAKEAFSVGDAMRDIYTHGVITTDFVLIMGDLVSNIPIDEVVRVHRERRRTNKDALMTIVVKEAGAEHRTRPRGETSVFVLDAHTSECLHYESVVGYPPKAQIRIPREIFADHPELDIRNDFIDCSIDICSVEVPSLFQDNFDYLDIRRDFVHGVLTSDLLAKNIYCHIAKAGYAARVKDTKSYAAVSRDILARWTFPLVPDDNHPGGHAYEHLRGNRYVARDGSVQLARSSTIGPHTLIGAHSAVSYDAHIRGSVLGRHVSIGHGAVVTDSYVWDGASIGSGCIIKRSIIGEGVHVKAGSHIEPGCLIGNGVVLGPDARLSKFTRVSKRKGKEKGKSAGKEESDDDEDSELEDIEAAQTDEIRLSLGSESNAIIWPEGPAEDDEDMDEVDTYDNQRLLRLADTASDLDISDAGSITESESESESGDDGDGNLQRLSSPASSATSLPSHSHSLSQPDAAAEAEFRSEVTQSLERAFSEGHSVDDAAVELKTLRMASNVPLRRVREAVVAAIVERIPLVDSAGVTAVLQQQQQRKAIVDFIGRWGELIMKIGGADAVETTSILQAYCASSTRLGLFGQILAALYQEDIVEEDDIRKWHATPSSQGTDGQGTTFTDNMHKCWLVGSRMIQQFDEQDTSESD